METFVQKAALVGQVIEDLTYEAAGPRQFKAELVGVKKTPQYKNGGFFVFSDLPPKKYTLQISGGRFQPQRYEVTIPLTPLALTSPPALDLAPVLDAPGDNELIVVARAVGALGNNIEFNPVILNKEIREGALVLAQGFQTRLHTSLDIGERNQAFLDSIAGILQGDIVRIIRDRSIRLKFDPYHRFPFSLTQIVGKVVSQGAPQIPQIPLSGALIRLTEVGGDDVTLNDVEGAKVATIGSGAAKIVLGVEKDVVTFTNQSGDYNLYSEHELLTGNATLEASFAGYQTQTKTIAITQLARNRVDFELVRS